MKIANLGSSFSAGPGIYPQSAPEAGRSALNFAHLFAEHFNAELLDLSVSGATLLNMLSEPQISHGHKFPPQVGEVPSDVDVVLVLGGGNDMHYVSNIIAETWVGWITMQSLKFLSRVRGTPLVPADEEVVYRRYGAVLDAIHDRAPKAQVVVIEYLTIFGPDAERSSNPPCTRERQEFHKTAAMNLQKATNRAASERQPWCQVLRSAQASEEHGLESQEPWVFGLDFATLVRREAWVHPNAAGMQAVAKMLIDKFTRAS